MGTQKGRVKISKLPSLKVKAADKDQATTKPETNTTIHPPHNKTNNEETNATLLQTEVQSLLVAQAQEVTELFSQPRVQHCEHNRATEGDQETTGVEEERGAESSEPVGQTQQI